MGSPDPTFGIWGSSKTRDEGIGMQSKESRKELIRDFKERKPLLGAYVVRCTATGRVWVGASRNLSATKNGTWFCLRNGSHMDKSLQEEWNTQGESSFEYAILDKLDEDVHPLAVDDLLKEKKKAWIAELGAQPLR
jgi:hypothetical protein